MKKQAVLLILCFIFFTAQAQFEQKLSAIFSTGFFKTFGKKIGQYDPFQMPNYRAGYLYGGGFQYHLTPRFSIVFQASYQHCGNWYYDGGGDVNYLHYSVYDSSEVLLAEGYNSLDFTTVNFGIYPRFYLLSWSKLNPFLFTGFTYNYSRSSFSNNEWEVRNQLDALPPDDTGPYNPWLEKNTGLGISPGIGIEYFPGNRIGFSVMAGYQFIRLEKDKFKMETLVENYHAFGVMIGMRIGLIRSKEL
jgi:hypothetical protein